MATNVTDVTTAKQRGRRGRGRAAATVGLIDAMIEIARIIQPCSVRALA
jgi:hypothetical protein